MKLLLLIMLVFTSIFAIEEKMIEVEIKNNVEHVLNTLKTNKSDKEKQEIIISKIETLFDFNTMAKISIGKKWGSMNEDEKIRFMEKFTDKLKLSFFEKLQLYSNEKVEYLPLEKNKDSRILLKTFIVSSKNNDKSEVIYKFYKNDKNEWYIYDVDIIGVSLVQSYRTQIADLLAKNNDDINILFTSLK